MTIKNLPKFELIDYINGNDLYAVDFLSSSLWLTVYGQRGEIVSGMFCGDKVDLPTKFRSPMVRIVSDECFIIAEPRVLNEEHNAFLVFPNAPSKHISFHAGDAISNILVTPNYIVVTYFDEGVFGSVSTISESGISIFDHEGVYQFNASKMKDRVFGVVDCYTACNIEKDKIAIYSYNLFREDWHKKTPFFTWDLEKNIVDLQTVPNDMPIPQAMTFYKNDWYFYSRFCPEGESILKHKMTSIIQQEVNSTLLNGSADDVLNMVSLRHGGFLKILKNGLYLYK